MRKQTGPAKEEAELLKALLDPEIAENPYNFVMFTFPWGKEGTPLEGVPGPRAWQKGALLDIAQHIKENKQRALESLPYEIYREATASGRGIGKSALVAWMIWWMMSTKFGSSVIVTANTESQLKSRTWAELGKWASMAINSHWFELTAMAMTPFPWLSDLVRETLNIDSKYWYAQAQLWSEERPDAFAGVHNHNGLMVIKDEASGIPQSIFNVVDGFFTEKALHRYQLIYSNPRRNSGAFFECFHKHRSFWRTRQIDSRTVEDTDTGVFDRLVQQHGEDSDVVRVEVKGQFPRQGENQLISLEDIRNARTRSIIPDPGSGLIIGVDVARFGDDVSVIAFRKGRDARSIPWKTFKGMDTYQLARHVAALADQHHPDIIAVDGGGAGGGVVDALKAMQYRVHEVQFGTRSDDPTMYSNKRTELWCKMADWLSVGCIPDEQRLEDDLLGPMYKYTLQDARSLEPKEQMKRRGFASPDWADALAVTFGVTVARKDSLLRRRITAMAKDVHYNLFGAGEY